MSRLTELTHAITDLDWQIEHIQQTAQLPTVPTILDDFFGVAPDQELSRLINLRASLAAERLAGLEAA